MIHETVISIEYIIIEIAVLANAVNIWLYRSSNIKSLPRGSNALNSSSNKA